MLYPIAQFDFWLVNSLEWPWPVSLTTYKVMYPPQIWKVRMRSVQYRDPRGVRGRYDRGCGVRLRPVRQVLATATRKS